MGQRDFLLKEEKIDKLPCGRRSTSMCSITVHTEVNKPDEAYASSGSFYLWVLLRLPYPKRPHMFIFRQRTEQIHQIHPC